MQRIVLAYSGSTASTLAVRWLAEHRRAEIVALTLDIGQGGDLEDVRDRALAAGAVRAHVLDAREEFVNQYLLRALRAGALYDDATSMATALGRPLLASRLIEIARIEATDAVAHACGDNDRRIDAAVHALDPAISVFSAPAPGAPDAGRQAARAASECPDEPAFVTIAFHRGNPSAVNGIAMPLVDLIGSVDIIAGAHGVGRLDRLETPGARVLHAAHQHLQTATLAVEVRRFAAAVARDYRDIIAAGTWFGPLRHVLDAAVEALDERLSGVVRLKLFKGACDTVAVTADEGPLKQDDYAVVRPLRFRA